VRDKNIVAPFFQTRRSTKYDKAVAIVQNFSCITNADYIMKNSKTTSGCCLATIRQID